MKKIKLYTIYNERFQELRHRFLSSIQDDYEVECIKFGDISEGDDWWRWVNAIAVKTRLTVDKVSENMGDVIIFSDIDIQFFGKTAPIVEAAMRDHDMAFLAEFHPRRRFLEGGKPNINTGFIAIRCTPRTLHFWKEVLATNIEDPRRLEQPIIRDLISAGKHDISWTLLPTQIWTQSHLALPKDIRLHHAIGTIDPAEKLAQMDTIKKFVDHRFFLLVLPQILGLKALYGMLAKRVPAFARRLKQIYCAGAGR